MESIRNREFRNFESYRPYINKLHQSFRNSYELACENIKPLLRRNINKDGRKIPRAEAENNFKSSLKDLRYYLDSIGYKMPKMENKEIYLYWEKTGKFKL